MKNMQRTLSLILAVFMLLVLNTAAFAAEDDTGYSDVAATSWYARAVAYVTKNSLMNGTGDAQFSPNESTNLAMLVTILHRDAGSPTASAEVPAGASGWYADAAAWADEQGLLEDVNTAFTGTPISREDMVTVLWRYAGRPTGSREDFADEANIAEYAAQAVDWSRTNGVVGGKPGNLFDPKGSATRAELATILQNFLTMEQSTPTPQPETPAENDGRVLIAFFSRAGENYGVGNIEKGNTHVIAEMIAQAVNGDLFHIETVTPYPDAYDNCTAVAQREQRENARPELTASVENMAAYDTIYLGYPIWYGDMPMAVYTFLESYDLAGKTIIPFCTHAGSGLSGTESSIASVCPNAQLLPGLAISGQTAQNNQNSAQSSVLEWLGDRAA